MQVAVSIEKGNLQNLNKSLEVAELFDEIDPAFKSFLEQLINIEEQYRRDSTIDNRFADLLPDRSIERFEQEMEQAKKTEQDDTNNHAPGKNLDNTIFNIVIECFSRAAQTGGPWQQPLIDGFVKLLTTDDVKGTLYEMNKFYGQYTRSIEEVGAKRPSIEKTATKRQLFFSKATGMEVSGAHLTDEKMADFYNRIK